jgi:hypothetical protein
MFPIPKPTPVRAIVARPAPIYFAASASIIFFLLKQEQPMFDV